MPRSRRPLAVTALLLLLAALFAPKPCALAGGLPESAARTALAAAARPTPPAAAEPGSSAPETSTPGRPAMAPALPDSSVSVPTQCAPDRVPVRQGPDVVVGHPHADPLPGPGGAAVPYVAAALPEVAGARAPPLPVAGCAELLPVLRI